MIRPPPLRAILLCRVSTKHEEQDTSIERQLARLDLVARLRGWIVVDRVATRTSGATVIDRPDVGEALDKLIANKADVLVVDHLFRLGRNVKELLQVIDTLGACGGAFYDATHEIDTTTPNGRMVFTLVATMGEYQIRDQRRKIREGLDRARARGAKLGRKRVVPIDVAREAKALREEKTAEGRQLAWSEIALLLAAKGRGKFSRGALAINVARLDAASSTAASDT